jgi:hypothetical protein
MSEEVTIHLESEPEPEAIHDAVTAAITEAEHREDVEESLEQIEEATDGWQAQQTAILSTQQAILGALVGIQATLSQWTTQQEAMVMASAPMPDAPIEPSDTNSAPRSDVEETFLNTAESAAPSAEEAKEERPSARTSNMSLSRRLRNLLR